MASPTEEIKSRIDIADFIGGYVKLQKAGRNYKGLCPFHQEKTPSFIVTPDRQMWHCFGCGEGGDVFKFLMRYENLEFYEALKFLAEKAGVEIQRVSPAEQKEFGVLYGINEAAKDFFKEQLFTPAGKPALDYLLSRGLNKQTIEEFELGWAGEGDLLNRYLLNLGFGIEDIRRAGLMIKTESGLNRGRFIHRATFPLYNNFGKVVGFTGRILPRPELVEGPRPELVEGPRPEFVEGPRPEFVEGPRPELVEGPSAEAAVKTAGASGFQPPKYLNSPETAIFKKARLLYGFHKSKNEIAKLREAFLVEGQMDFLMAWQIGVKNAVAVSGTAFSSDHLKTLRRLADVLAVSFDNDEAGVRALERVLDATADWDFSVQAIDLGRFKDPAEAAVADPNFLISALKQKRHAFDYLLAHYFKKAEEKENDPVFKKNILWFLIQKIINLKSQIDQAHWLKELGLKFGIEEKALAMESERLKNSGKSAKIIINPASPKQIEKQDLLRHNLIAERLLTLVLAKENFWPELAESRNYFPDSFRDFFGISAPAVTVGVVGLAVARPDLSLRSTFEFSNLEDDKIKKEFFELIKNLKLEFLKKRSLELKKEITLAEKAKNEEFLKDCIAKFQAVSTEMANLI
ncbi:MAG: toprim domain-containing protein [Candidatus Brennerbacteria bacterium]|nr:toprim domain-containing protein [Candidatus Brennerbacteria bacterium]